MLSSIPHPVRAATDDSLLSVIDTMGAELIDALKSMLTDLSLHSDDAYELVRELPEFKKWKDKVGLRDDHADAIFATLSPYFRLKLCNGRMFEVRPELDLMLSQTDIGKKSPALLFRPPFPCLYIHFGSYGGGLNPADGVEGYAANMLEGAYITELLGRHTEYHSAGTNVRDGENVRYYEVHLIATGDEDTRLMPVCSYTITIPEHMEDESLETVLGACLTDATGVSDEDDRFISASNMAVFHIAKILLYLGSESAVLESENDQDVLLGKLDKTKGKGKRAKIEKKLRRSFNKIIVGPKDALAEAEQGSSAVNQGRSVATHWRRGHFRYQPYGEGLSERRLIWIKPTIVGLSGGSNPPIKRYEIK